MPSWHQKEGTRGLASMALGPPARTWGKYAAKTVPGTGLAWIRGILGGDVVQGRPEPLVNWIPTAAIINDGRDRSRRPQSKFSQGSDPTRSRSEGRAARPLDAGPGDGTRPPGPRASPAGLFQRQHPRPRGRGSAASCRKTFTGRPPRQNLLRANWGARRGEARAKLRGTGM